MHMYIYVYTYIYGLAIIIVREPSYISMNLGGRLITTQYTYLTLVNWAVLSLPWQQPLKTESEIENLGKLS